MILVPILVGVIAFLVGVDRGRSRASARRAPRALAPGAAIIAGDPGDPGDPGDLSDPGDLGPQRAPSPLLVLDGFLRRGEPPPPPVVLCAIAEAELLGQLGVADELVTAFILPVVEAAERQAAMAARDANAPGDRGNRDARGPWGAQPGVAYGPPAPRRDGTTGRPAAPGAAQPAPPWQPTPLHQHRHHQHRPAEPGATDAPSFGAPMPRPIARAEDARVEVFAPVAAPVMPPRAAPPPPQSPTPAMASPAMTSTPRPQTLTVSGRSSPIDGVPAEHWAEFAGRVAREQPTFRSNHHVGQFRQRRSRLAELGIDPDSLVGSAIAQHAALDADMQDAYRHAVDSGLVAEYRGHTLEIPSGSTAAPVQVTLSGVLGVIQAAGLEGALSWLSDPADRQRFPGTTRAFLKTNGVF